MARVDVINRVPDHGIFAPGGHQAEVQRQGVGRLATRGILVSGLIQEVAVERLSDFLGQRSIVLGVGGLAQDAGRLGQTYSGYLLAQSGHPT